MLRSAKLLCNITAESGPQVLYIYWGSFSDLKSFQTWWDRNGCVKGERRTIQTEWLHRWLLNSTVVLWFCNFFLFVLKLHSKLFFCQWQIWFKRFLYFPALVSLFTRPLPELLQPQLCQFSCLQPCLTRNNLRVFVVVIFLATKSTQR